MTLEEKLSISKEQQNIIDNGVKGVKKPTPRPQVQQTLVGSPEQLDNAVFGASDPSIKSNRYDPKEEMKRIEERRKEGAKIDYSKSNIPKSILESIIKEPLDMPTSDAKMEALTERLSKKLPSGIGRSYEIQSKLENTLPKASKVNEAGTKAMDHNGGVDYELIKMIVENVIDKKINSIQSALLTESKNDGASLKAMKMGNKFLFLDNDNNVYECQMKFIGKNKRKK